MMRNKSKRNNLGDERVVSVLSQQEYLTGYEASRCGTLGQILVSVNLNDTYSYHWGFLVHHNCE